jgi:hypothetical protein
MKILTSDNLILLSCSFSSYATVHFLCNVLLLTCFTRSCECTHITRWSWYVTVAVACSPALERLLMMTPFADISMIHILIVNPEATHKQSVSLFS